MYKYSCFVFLYNSITYWLLISYIKYLFFYEQNEQNK